MSSYRVRAATPDDAEALGHIGAATFLESFITEIEGSAMIQHCTREHSKTVYENYLAQATTGCWIAEYNETGAPIGYALNCTPDLPVETHPGELELKRIYLLSRFHGAGVAVALMDASIAHARSQGAPRLLLGTYEGNARALAFYHKYGFETVGTRKFNVGGQVYDDIVMAKPL